MAESQFDLTEALDRVDGDRELLGELAQIFSEESPRMLNELRTFVASGDAKGVQHTAHTLRGSLSSFGAKAAAAAALALETMARDGTLVGASQHLCELEREVAHLERGLLQFREDSPA